MSYKMVFVATSVESLHDRQTAYDIREVDDDSKKDDKILDKLTIEEKEEILAIKD